jgi:hypothetical protein
MVQYEQDSVLRKEEAEGIATDRLECTAADRVSIPERRAKPRA